MNEKPVIFGWAVSTLLCFACLMLFLMFNGSTQKVNFDALTISVTVLEIFLVISAFAGFWMLKSVVKEKADDAARECANKYFEENFEPMVRRSVENYLSLNGTNGSNDIDISGIMESIGENDDT